jgi:hypothetical protein
LLPGDVLRQTMQVQIVLNSPVSIPEPAQGLSGNPGAQKRPLSVRFNVQKNIRGLFYFSGWKVIASRPGRWLGVFDNGLVAVRQWHHILHGGAEYIHIIRVGHGFVGIIF